MMYIYMSDHLCIPGINAFWLRCMILLIYCWIRFANILLRIFTSLFIRDCCCLVAKSCLTLVTAWNAACQAPLSMGFFGRGYWSGLPFPSPGDLPTQGSHSCLLHWQVDSYHWAHLGKPFIKEIVLWLSFLVVSFSGSYVWVMLAS